jgi:hypothetical protein
VGLKNLGLAVSAGFGVIIRVLFYVLCAALRVLLALMVARGRGEAVKDVADVGSFVTVQGVVPVGRLPSERGRSCNPFRFS